MNDSNRPDISPDGRREQRLDQVKRWVTYIESAPAEEWGEQLNSLVNAQLAAAQEADLSVEQLQRIEQAGAAFRDE